MSPKKFSLTVWEERIKRAPVAKYLELLIEEKLQFDVHIKHVCKQIVTNLWYILLSPTLQLSENPPNVAL